MALFLNSASFTLFGGHVRVEGAVLVALANLAAVRERGALHRVADPLVRARRRDQALPELAAEAEKCFNLSFMPLVDYHTSA